MTATKPYVSMIWDPTPYTIAGVVATGICITVAAIIWRYRSEHVALPLLTALVVLAAWSFTYGVQLGFRSLAGQLVVQRATLAVGGLVPTVWLFFAVEYAGRNEWLTWPRRIALGSEMVGFALLSLTNPWHGLVWSDATLVATPGGPVASLTFGSGYVVHIVYAYLVVICGIVVLMDVAARISPMYRRQVGFLIVIGMPAILSHVAYTLGISPVPGLDLTPFVLPFTGLGICLAMFRFDLLERSPTARQLAIEELGVGIVVVDADGTIVEVDGVALAALDPSPEVDESIEHVFPETDLESVDGSTITTDVQGASKAYDLSVTMLRDHHGQSIGYMLLLHDVTERHSYQQRLEVTNRVLRHNLRNDGNVITGFAGQLEEAFDNGYAADARKIRETAEGLLALGEKARQMTEIDAPAGERAAIDVVEVMDRVIESFETDHPDARFDIDAPPSATATVVSEAAFETAVQNVVENAIEHNDEASPGIEVTIRSTDSKTTIEVADDGPGIPQMEREVIEAGTETSLQHSQGLGLWLAKWVTSASDGTIDLEADSGATVILEFPRGE